MLAATGSIPYIGTVVAWVVTPLVWLMCTLAYVRQTRGVEEAQEFGMLASPAAGA